MLQGCRLQVGRCKSDPESPVLCRAPWQPLACRPYGQRQQAQHWAGSDAACCLVGLADASGPLQIAPLDLHSSAGHHGGPVASSADSEATFSDALLGSSAPSPSTVLAMHPSQVLLSTGNQYLSR